jgi:glycosyltransferase involved in cell wall biosynthesis
MKNPLVSIITPTYNHEKYIGECIESVLRQSFENWEMIIINDGSSDRTEEVILSYTDDRIIYIKQENKGPYKLGKTYNAALVISKGEYIAILEGDDFWPPKKLEYQLPVFNDKNIVYSHGRAKFVYDCNGKRNIKNVNIREINPIINNDPIGMALYPLLGIVGSNPVAVTIMFRKDALMKIGGFQESKCLPFIDYPTNLEISLEGKYKYIKKNLGYFRRHKYSITHKIRKDEIETCSEQYTTHFIKRKNKEKIDIPIKNFHIFKKNKKGISNLIHGKELYDLCMYEDSRKVFKDILNGFEGNRLTLKYKLLAFAGLISSYTHLDILGLLIKCYSSLESTYWNLKFNKINL